MNIIKCECLSPYNIYYVKCGVAVNDLWKILVPVVKQMLQIKKPLFDDPQEITIIIQDKCRVTSFRWKKKVGDVSHG